MRSKVEYRRDLPECGLNLALKRTRPLIQFYGKNIATVSLEQLSASCYLQGIDDAVSAESKPEPDYQI